MNKIKQKQTYSQAIAKETESKASSATRGKMKNISPTVAIIVTLALLVGLGMMLFNKEWEMLYRAQELSLFLPTRQFYESMQIYPGGTLQWMGCWATQFFYHPEWGIALMVGIWGLITVLLQRHFRLRGWSILLTWLPILMLMTGIVQTGYWLYYTKLQGYFFVPSLGVLLSLVFARTHHYINANEMATGTTALIRRILSCLFMVLFAWFGYQHMGAWSFLGIALMAVPSSLAFMNPAEQRFKTGKGIVNTLVPLILAVMCVFCVPRIAYSHVYVQTQIDTIYVASMPSFRYNQFDNLGMKQTYYLLFASFIPMLFCLAPAFPKMKGWTRKAAGTLAIMALVGFAFTQLKDKWYRDIDFNSELIMNRCIEEENWQGVLDVAPSWTETDTLKNPTRCMVMMKNLALFRLGKAGNEMFNYLEGDHEARMDSLVIRITQVSGKQLYYNYGKLNFCYRWCMEDGVEFGWKVEHYRFMAKCALLKGEWKVARKYLNILKQTRYHKEWAEKYEAYVDHPERMEQDPTMAPICKLKEFGDRLDGDNSLVELYLLRTFNNGRGVDPVFQETTLLCSMIMKDIDSFWPRFNEYCHIHATTGDFHMPRHYQEAVLLYSVLEPNRPSVMNPSRTNKEVLPQLPIDESVKKSYDDFMAFNGRADIAPLPESQKRIAFQPYFGNTFYYFYFLVRGQKTY